MESLFNEPTRYDRLLHEQMSRFAVQPIQLFVVLIVEILCIMKKKPLLFEQDERNEEEKNVCKQSDYKIVSRTLFNPSDYMQ